MPSVSSRSFNAFVPNGFLSSCEKVIVQSYYLALTIGIFVIAQMSRAKQYDWTITFSHEDKNPFGTKALNDLLETKGINLLIRITFYKNF